MPFGNSPRLLARLLAAASLAGLTATGPALAGDVGVSIQFSQPGVYGRVDIGQYPQPQLILAAPVIVEPPPVPPPMPPEPLYLYVPREHQEHWREHCREYHACGHPVYFVHHDWYRDHVMSEHRGESYYEHGRGREEHEHEHGRGRDRERDRDENDRGR